jgi:hypothetical protein
MQYSLLVRRRVEKREPYGSSLFRCVQGGAEAVRSLKTRDGLGEKPQRGRRSRERTRPTFAGGAEGLKTPEGAVMHMPKAQGRIRRRKGKSSERENTRRGTTRHAA